MKTRDEIIREIGAISYVMGKLPILNPEHPDYKDLVDFSAVLTNRVQQLNKKLDEIKK